MVTSPIVRTPFSRVFIQEGSSPAIAPEYQALARATTVDFSLGDITPVRQPSVSRYGQFTTIDNIRGQPDNPTLPIEARYRPTLSDLLRIANTGCEIEIHVHFGRCQNPEDFDGGWDKQLILEQALPSNYSTTDLGALDADQDATIEETVSFEGQRVYEVKKLLGGEQAAAEIVAPVVDVEICDSVSCGECGIASDGCQIVFVLASELSGSPGLGVELLFTINGGSTYSSTTITTIGAGENATAMKCVGTNLVVVSEDSNSIHIAPIADILAGTETWTEVTTGFTVGDEPTAMYSAGATATWFAGNNGTIYFTADVTTGVTQQTSGSLTTEDLNDIDGLNRLNVVAVGNNNAVLVTENGGTTWALAPSGPAAGVNLNTVVMRSALEWLVGTADGRLFFTRDAGVNWTEKAFPGSGAGVVHDLSFASRNVGYMAHSTATPAGRILRTTNGGFSWVVLPEQAGQVIPANDQVSTLAACIDDVNVVFGGGIADDGVDGFLVKFA